jgi:hypothetical protein
MPHAPQDPAVREAYQDLIRQTTDQYQALESAGYKFWFIDSNSDAGQQYASSPFNALRDLRANKSMGVFPTDAGFGTKEDFNPESNPMLADTGLRWPFGGPNGELKPVYANDLFRAVHDAFGHGLEGSGFRAEGEENAWQAHIRLFTGPARGAITTETRGQNSWLNYGPYGERNRTAKTEDTVFADQKTGLMPEWTWNEGIAPDEGASVEGQRYMPAGDMATGRGVKDHREAMDLFEKGYRLYGALYDGMEDPIRLKKASEIERFDPENLWAVPSKKIAAAISVRNMPADIQRDIGRNQDFANPPTDAEAVDALSSEKKAKFGAARSIKPGTQVAARIDIPAFLRTGKYVVAVHEPDGAAGGPGKVIGYDTVTRLQNPKFVVKPGVQRIYEGKSAKFPVATVDGKIMADRSIPGDLENYVPVGMDPKEHAYFYDKRTDQPVIGGSESVSVGNTVFVKNPVYGKPEDFRFMPDYSGEHKAPQRDSGAPLDNLKGVYPDDVYGPNAAQYYGHSSGDATDKAAARIIQATKGKPDAPVKVFRAIPKSIQSNEINPGDWITTIKSYAVQHGEGPLGGDYKILEKTVPAGDLYTNGDSIFEFGYDPKFMPSPDSAMPGAYSFPGGYRALPGKAKGSLRLYSPAGSLIGIAASLDEAQRIIRKKARQ